MARRVLASKATKESQTRFPSQGEWLSVQWEGFRRALAPDVPTASHMHPSLSRAILPCHGIPVQDHGERRGGHFHDLQQGLGETLRRTSLSTVMT